MRYFLAAVVAATVAVFLLASCGPGSPGGDLPRTCEPYCPTGCCHSGTCDCGVVDMATPPPDVRPTDLLPAPDLAVLMCGGKPCAFANATAVCDNGVCLMGACNVGSADCNGKPADGCEVNTATSPSDCGGCGKACSEAHMVAACVGGECFGGCAPNYADCNMDKRTDGCETSVGSDAKHCGACGMACGDNQMCKEGKCVCQPIEVDPQFICGCLGLPCCPYQFKKCVDGSMCDAMSNFCK